MNDEDWKKLNEAHKKAMDAINEFNKEARGLSSAIRDVLGKK